MKPAPDTLVTVPTDLNSVTTVGHEDDPTDTGPTRADIEALWSSVQSWYRLGTTPPSRSACVTGGRSC